MVEVDIDADVDVEVDVEESIAKVGVNNDGDVEVSLDVVSPLGLSTMKTEAAAPAAPAVLIEATEVPLDNGKKSLVSVLSQQTLDGFRLWSQHQSPP